MGGCGVVVGRLDEAEREQCSGGRVWRGLALAGAGRGRVGSGGVWRLEERWQEDPGCAGSGERVEREPGCRPGSSRRGGVVGGLEAVGAGERAGEVEAFGVGAGRVGLVACAVAGDCVLGPAAWLLEQGAGAAQQPGCAV